MLNSGLVSLNSSYCWLDLWAFEATVDELEQAFTDEQPSEIVTLTDRLLKLYRDAFLKDSDSGIRDIKTIPIIE